MDRPRLKRRRWRTDSDSGRTDICQVGVNRHTLNQDKEQMFLLIVSKLGTKGKP